VFDSMEISALLPAPVPLPARQKQVLASLPAEGGEVFSCAEISAVLPALALSPAE
jgi:hypothetical protein